VDIVRKSLAEFNFTQKYARYNSDLGRRETWNEACDRVLDMHLRKYADRGPVVAGLLEAASKAEKEKLFRSIISARTSVRRRADAQEKLAYLQLRYLVL